MFREIREDFRAIRERDPAARGWFERLLCYPGFHALAAHRVLHPLHAKLKLRTLARILSQVVRLFTGVEIHPGATVGRGVFIDHGMGVVIGETSIVGDSVTLFQGVTLGGTGKERGKRHPTLEENVVVGAGAQVLGDIAIGRGARIGAGSVVVQPVPPQATVVGVPGRIVAHTCPALGTEALDHGNLPDPVRIALFELQAKIQHAEEEIHQHHQFLDEVRTCKAREVAEARARTDPADLTRRLTAARESLRPFRAALERASADGRVAVIAEVKRKSPSAGVLVEDYHPGEIARTYEAGGAAAISVLTDRCHFQGELADVGLVREAASLPVLRKDFLIDTWQISEAAAAGADAVLLIVSMLSDSQLREMLAVAKETGVDALVEVHTEHGLEHALAADAELVGINSRDLARLTTDLAVAERLAPKVPEGRFVVAESGIHSAEDVKRLAGVGVRAVLVGEHLLRQTDRAAAVRALRGEGPKGASPASG